MSWYDPWDIGSTTFHAITGTPNADEKRNQQYEMNDQIRAYKEQTDLSMKALEEKKNEADVEKRKINEKQIRALRSNFRAPSGFLNNQMPKTTNDTSAALGQSSKLGG